MTTSSAVSDPSYALTASGVFAGKGTLVGNGAKLVEQGPYTISKGTGKYAGISGSGTAVATTTATLARMKDGKCDTSTTVTPVAGTEHATIKAVGKVHLPSRNRVVTTLAADTVRI
jgi:hypothetical protein